MRRCNFSFPRDKLICEYNKKEKEKEAMKVASTAYLAKIREIISRIETEEKASIAEGARMLARSIENGGLIHVFGTGHSHILLRKLSSAPGV